MGNMSAITSYKQEKQNAACKQQKIAANQLNTQTQTQQNDTTKKGNTSNMLPEQIRIPHNMADTRLFIHIQHNGSNMSTGMPKYLTGSIHITNFILSNKIRQILAPRVK